MIKVLVAEDDLVSRKVMVTALGKHDFEVAAAASGKEAIDTLKNGGVVDLIISDIMMPGMDGFTLLRSIKSDRRLRKIPVILCTTLNDQESVLMGIELGAADYISKPINPELLIDKVDKVLEAGPGAVLLVADQVVTRKLVETTLVREGFRLHFAGSVEEAQDIVENNKISVVIGDNTLPDGTGYDLLALLKVKKPDLSVVLMAERQGVFGKDKIIASGADGYLSKPLHNTSLIAKIESYTK